jgi:hypothetical protein
MMRVKRASAAFWSMKRGKRAPDHLEIEGMPADAPVATGIRRFEFTNP